MRPATSPVRLPLFSYIKKSIGEKLSEGGNTAILEGNVKTNSGFREIPIPDNVFAMLMQHKAAQDQEKSCYAEIYQDNAPYCIGGIYS